MALVRFILVVVSAILVGYTIQHLWLWFVVPTFKLPTLTLANAIGLRLLCTMATVTRLTVDEKDDNYTLSLLLPMLLYIIGWCLNEWFMVS